MKKIYLVILLLSVYIATASVTVSRGDILTYGNLEVKILGITDTKVKLSVGNVTNIVSIGESKEINDVTIRVIDVTYFDPELSSAIIEVALKPFCGDNNCNNDETSSNCCLDCGCEDDFDCINNRCVAEAESPEDECSANEDCNDNNESTIDICSKRKPGINKCLNYQSIICENDIDCDDKNPCTVDKCIANDCSFSIVENCSEKVNITENVTVLEENISQDTRLIKEEKIEQVKEKSFIKRLFSRLFSWLF